MTERLSTETVAGLPVHIWKGEPDGPTVLGLPGLGGSGHHWTPLADALPAAHVVAPDLRGRGLAYQATGPMGFRSHVADLRAIAAELDLRGVVIVGHSMGAYLAPVAAGALGDRVRKLVLLDGGVRPKLPFFMNATVTRFVFGRQMKRMQRPFASVDEFFAVSNKGVLANRPDHVAGEYSMLAHDLDGDRVRLDPARCVADAVDSFFGPDVEPALDALRVPATLLAAAHGRTDKDKPFLSDAAIAKWTARQPLLTAQRIEANHMTILFSPEFLTAVTS
jgi:pimeloyl-ACP methyl ester carboxylesterase